MLLSYTILDEILSKTQLAGATLVILANIAIAVDETQKKRKQMSVLDNEQKQAAS